LERECVEEAVVQEKVVNQEKAADLVVLVDQEDVQDVLADK
jgi:hypothetical protein